MDNLSLFFWIFGSNGQSYLIDRIFIFGADNLIYLLFGLIILLGLWGGAKEKKAFLLILLALPLAVILIKIIHLFYYEQRPFVTYNFLPLVSEGADASFPSRHATISAVLAFVHAYYKSKWAPFFLFTMLWIGFSRVYIGVHYPLDVLGGFATAIIALEIAILVRKILRVIFLRF